MILLLFSGGLDSMLLAEQAHREGLELVTLFFRYPHPSIPEEYNAVAEWHRQKVVDGHQIRHIEINLPLWGADSMSIGVGEEGPRVLAGRNQVMVSTAVNIAASIGAKEVWYGANADDADYPDCGPLWVELMNGLAQDWGVTVRAPLLFLGKAKIKEKAAELGLSGWWSCYEPRDGQPCGTCNSCKANQ